MKSFFNDFRLLSCLVLFGASSACSLSSKDGSSIYVDLSSLDNGYARFSLLNSGGGVMGLAPPSSSTGFACYAVNVTGPGIADTSRNPNPYSYVEFDKAFNGSSYYCNYRGIVSPPLYIGSGPSDVVLPIPPGPARLVQVAGINDSAICASGVIDGGDSNSGSNNTGSKVFEIGRARLFDVFGDRSVSIPVDWPTGAGTSADFLREQRAIDCGGDCNTLDQIRSDVVSNPYGVVLSDSTAYMQPIPTEPGKYIKEVQLFLKNVPTNGIIYVGLYEKSSASTVIPLSSYQITKTIVTAIGTSGEVVAFSMASNLGQYFQMQSGKEYLIGVKRQVSTFPDWSHKSGTCNTCVYSMSGGTLTAQANIDGMDYRIKTCY